MVEPPENPEQTPDRGPQGPNPLVKLAIEFGPVFIFFVTYFKSDIFVATGVFMGAITISLLASWWLERRLPPMALFTAVFVLILGGLTLYFGSAMFIQLKPTIVNVLFALILGGGLVTNRLFLKIVFGSSFQLTEVGWRLMTYRWIGFFLFLAVLNEVVRQVFSEPTWVKFKFWGIVPLTLVFSLLQVPFLLRHAPATEEGAEKQAEG